jgi:hypothetical protein
MRERGMRFREIRLKRRTRCSISAAAGFALQINCSVVR